MNKIQRKLKKLKALAEMVSRDDKKQAQKKSDWEFDFYHYREIMIDGIDNLESMPEISIAICEVNCLGHSRHQTSWTSVPYDSVYESWVRLGEMSDEFYTETSGIVRLIRLASRVGMHNIKFGAYKRTIDSCDYFNFEVKQSKPLD